MENFTPIQSALGGAVIGLGAALMLFGLGRIAGISGIFGGLVKPSEGDVSWRGFFIGGLVLGGSIMSLLMPELFVVRDVAARPLGVVAVAGLIVGFGTRMGNGCTSGHGVCGISRLSPRSIVATVTFMTTGAISAFLAREAFGGLS